VASRSYSDKDLKRLFGLAAGRCSFSDCRTKLVHWSDSPDDPVVLGQIGHIVASSDGGPRADPSMDGKERDQYSNLILVCSSHHKLVDSLESVYTVDDLKAFKVVHERWVEETLEERMDSLTSAELEIVCKAIQSSTHRPSTELKAVPTQEKLDYNSLTARVQNYLTMGLMRSDEVAQYIEMLASQIYPQFPGQLRDGFMREYEALWRKGLRGDSLFIALMQFAGGGSNTDFDRQAAGLAVLSYLFQVCEVFEGPQDASS
jgi:hypothetical protein